MDGNERRRRQAPPPPKAKKKMGAGTLTPASKTEKTTPAPNGSAPSPSPSRPDSAPPAAPEPTMAPAAPAQTPPDPTPDPTPPGPVHTSPAPDPEPAPVTTPQPDPEPAPVAQPPADPEPAPATPAPSRAPAVRKNTTSLAKGKPTATPWSGARVPQRPTSAPTAETVLESRWFERDQLNASVPTSLELNDRITLLLLAHRLDRTPPGDVVAVAVDWWLRSGRHNRNQLDAPWDAYVGEGTPEHIPLASDALNKRWIEREPLRASVPRELDLNHRLKAFVALNRLKKTPVGDVVAVAVDAFLRMMCA